MSDGTSNSMAFTSLFAGIGGFDLGFERAGLSCVGQAEKDTAALSVLERHWPNTDRCDDVESDDAKRLVRSADIICGGFPCQDLSVAGARRGLAGERSGLFFRLAELIGLARPRWFVLENVPGLLSSNGGADMRCVVRELCDLGYGVAWRVLDAQFFGVAQRRRRVFIVGCRGDVRRAGAVLFDREGGRRNLAKGKRPGESIAPAVTTGTRGNGEFETSGGLTVTHRVSPCLQERDAKGQDSDCTKAMVVIPIKDPSGWTPGKDLSKAAGGPPVGNAGDPSFTILSRHHANAVAIGGDVSHTLTGEGFDASEDGTGRGTPVVAVAQNQRGELRESETHPCLSTGGGKPGEGYPAVRQGFVVRRLMPVECERLQGFPDSWTRWLACGKEQSDSQRYKQLGNAVAVPVAEWIGRRIKAIEEAKHE